MSDISTQDQKVGLILIGDELLSGVRQDKHMTSVLKMLRKRGMSLAWVRIIGDTRKEIVDTLNQTKMLPEVVFSFGGIGATPDDQTRAAAAEAFEQNFICHPEAKALLVEKFGDSVYPHRILMAEMAENAELVPNPINQVPGFKLANHHFVPGFPNMSWPMVEWVLDTHYAHLFNKNPNVEWRWDVRGVPESSLVNMMNEIISSFDGVGISSLPSTKERGNLIDFGLKGPEAEVDKASTWLESYFNENEIDHKFRGAI
ncbi:MAG: molybdopterin-binding protein [Cocleimonas sp.]